MEKFYGRIFVALAMLIACGCSQESKKAQYLERADRYFGAGEYEKAKIEYMNLLRLDQKHVRAFQQIGLIWAEQGAPLRAIPFLLKARELGSKDVAARSKLALELMAIGDATEARKEGIWILQQDPANSNAIIVLADSSRNTDEVATAEQALEKFPQKNTAAFHLAAASLAIKKGNLASASDEIQQALAADPKSARAHLIMGLVHALRKEPDQAGSELKRAAELAPSRSEERMKYAEFLAASGASNEAKSLLQAITKQTPDYIPAWRALAQIALTGKHYDEALSFLENVFSRDPDNPDARILQANIYLLKGDNAKAIATLDRLNTTYPRNPAVKFGLGRAYAANNELARATVAIEQALAIKPDYTEALLALAELNLHAGKVQAVVGPMEELRKKRPDLPQPRILLADCYRALGRLEDAASLFREQVKLTPESADDYFLLGMVLREQNKLSESRAAFEKASELKPEDWRLVDQLVDLDVAERQFEVAAQRVQAYQARNPGQAAGHFMQGKIAAAQQGWARSESELQKAIDLDPNFGQAYGGLVSVYVAQKKLPQAIVRLQSALEKRPNDPGILLTLGLTYEQMKDYLKARDSYEKLLETTPDFVVALNNLAYICAEHLNQLDRAYDLAKKARSLQPDEPSIADSLGWILYKRGDYEQALALLRESAGKRRDDAEIQFHLGMAASRMGQEDLARAALEKAVQSAAEFSGKDEAQRRLASLQSGSITHDATSTGPTEHSQDLLALTRRAESYEQKGDTVQAAAAYEEALRLNPKILSAVLKLAQLYAGPLQNRDRALDLAKQARALAPTDPKVAAILGQIALQFDNFSWAYSLLQESARRNSDDPAVLHDLAMAAYAMGKVPEARQTMERCREAAPDSPQSEDARKFLAMTALDRPSADAVAAAPEVIRLLTGQPDYVPALMAEAAIHLQQDNAVAAAESYSRVLQKYPDFAPAQARLAAIYSDDPQKLSAAYDFAVKARKTLSDSPELIRTLAKLSFRRNEFSYAIQLFQQSNAKQPLPAKDLYYLGLAQLQMKQKDNGRESLESALAAGLQEPLAQEARKRLSEP